MMIPREHGAWAMLIVPFLLGVLEGGYTHNHLLLFLGMLFAYMGSYALLQIAKAPKNSTKRKQALKWSVSYCILSAIFLIPLVYMYPEIIWLSCLIVPGAIITFYFAKKNNERSLWNDLVAVMILALGGAAALHVSAFGGNSNSMSGYFEIWILNVLFFMMSVFHVKSLLRERANKQFKLYSRVYHLVAIVIAYWILPHLWFLAFIPAGVKGIGRSAQKTPMAIGIVELVHSILFVILVFVLGRIL